MVLTQGRYIDFNGYCIRDQRWITRPSKQSLSQIKRHVDQRLVLRQNLYHQTLARHIESHRVQVGSTYRGGGLANVIINECHYLFYDFSVQLTKKTKSNTYYFIDSTAPVGYAEFEKAIGANHICFYTSSLANCPVNRCILYRPKTRFFMSLPERSTGKLSEASIPKWR